MALFTRSCRRLRNAFDNALVNAPTLRKRNFLLSAAVQHAPFADRLGETLKNHNIVNGPPMFVSCDTLTESHRYVERVNNASLDTIIRAIADKTAYSYRLMRELLTAPSATKNRILDSLKGRARLLSVRIIDDYNATSSTNSTITPGADYINTLPRDARILNAHLYRFNVSKAEL